MSSGPAQDIAVRYLLAARSRDQQAAIECERDLAGLSEESLADSLANDQAKLAFWIDTYNAVVVRQPSHDFHSIASRTRFFSRRGTTIAGHKLALDTIEHGILRRSQLKIGLGFITNPFSSAFERRHRVTRTDPRIHFALNCAAASCPPIAAYRESHIEEQLVLATRSYLDASVAVDDRRIVLPRMFLWFAGDFGGRRGVRSFLSRYNIDHPGRRLRFAPFDWTPAPGRWSEAGWHDQE